MNVLNAPGTTRLAELVRLGLYGIQKTKLHCGNVTFWFSKGELIYSLPISAWNVNSVKSDIEKFATMGLDRARKAVES